MIKVEEGAQQTNAYQENRNLLLEDAHADSIPGLEIEANDVRCTHGATVGQVDRDQLFYLMARGLSRAEAERLSCAASSGPARPRRAGAGARGPRRGARGADPSGVGSASRPSPRARRSAPSSAPSRSPSTRTGPRSTPGTSSGAPASTSRVAHLLLSRPPGEPRDQARARSGSSRTDRDLVQRGEGVHSLGSTLELPGRLCAAQHEHGEQRALSGESRRSLRRAGAGT